jgi:hypothetical protein
MDSEQVIKFIKDNHPEMVSGLLTLAKEAFEAGERNKERKIWAAQYSEDTEHLNVDQFLEEKFKELK